MTSHFWDKTVKITRVASKKHLEYFAVSEKILNFAVEFIHHLTEGNQRTLGQDALRPLLFLIGHKKRIPAKACHRNSLLSFLECWQAHRGILQTIETFLSFRKPPSRLERNGSTIKFL